MYNFKQTFLDIFLRTRIIQGLIVNAKVFTVTWNLLLQDQDFLFRLRNIIIHNCGILNTPFDLDLEMATHMHVRKTSSPIFILEESVTFHRFIIHNWQFLSSVNVIRFWRFVYVNSLDDLLKWKNKIQW